MAKISFTFSKYQLNKINHHKIIRTVVGHVETKKGGLNRPIQMNVSGRLLAGDLPFSPTFLLPAIKTWRKNKINFNLNHCVVIHQLMNEGIKFKPQEIDKDLLKKCKCKKLRKLTTK
jgi:hypothetical protein